MRELGGGDWGLEGWRPDGEHTPHLSRSRSLCLTSASDLADTHLPQSRLALQATALQPRRGSGQARAPKLWRVPFKACCLSKSTERCTRLWTRHELTPMTLNSPQEAPRRFPSRASLTQRPGECLKSLSRQCPAVPSLTKVLGLASPGCLSWWIPPTPPPSYFPPNLPAFSPPC